jgi:plastocyanin
VKRPESLRAVAKNSRYNDPMAEICRGRSRVTSCCWTGAILLLSIGVGRAATDRLQGTIRVDGRPAKDVVIWFDSGAGVTPAPDRVVLDQRNLEFVPRVLVVRVGTPVEMPNSDLVFHNVFSFHHGKRFDLGLYPVGTRKIVTFDRPGVSRIFCNIHPTMAAYVVVVESPHFAVTDAAGIFTMPNVGPGTHGYHLWRAGAEAASGTIVVDPARPIVIDWP